MAQPAAGFRYSVDAFWLAGFALELQPSGRALDLCTGSGIVAFLLAAQGLDVQGIDNHPLWAEVWRRSSAPASPTLSLGDARRCSGGFDLVTCNPPYHPVGTGPISPKATKAAAHTELAGTLAEIHAAALRSRAPNGWVVFVVPTARAAELPPAARVVRIGNKRCLLAWGGSPAPTEHLRRDQAERFVRRARQSNTV